MKHDFKVGDIIKCISKPFGTDEIKIGKEYEVKKISNIGLFVETDTKDWEYGYFKRWEKTNKEWDNIEN